MAATLIPPTESDSTHRFRINHLFTVLAHDMNDVHEAMQEFDEWPAVEQELWLIEAAKIVERTNELSALYDGSEMDYAQAARYLEILPDLAGLSSAVTALLLAHKCVVVSLPLTHL